MKPRDEHNASVLLYLYGELSGHELEDFLAHLANCVDCTMFLEEEKALSQLLHRTHPLYPAPVTLRRRVAQIETHSADVYNYAPDRLRCRIARILARSVRGVATPVFRWQPLTAM